jgi:ubiquinone/menaquinone biosynthesis C-methylase UbiE
MFDHFDLLAPIYDRLIPAPSPTRLQTLLHLPTTGALLDVGGGTGRVSSLLRPMVDRLVIADFSRQMLSQSRQKTDTRPLQSVAERLPFPDASFERILVVDALHHFHHQQLAIGELLRVLKPGGRLVIEEPDINRFVVKLVALAEKITLMGSHFHSPREISQMVAAYGFEATITTDGSFAAWVCVTK